MRSSFLAAACACFLVLVAVFELASSSKAGQNDFSRQGPPDVSVIVAGAVSCGEEGGLFVDLQINSVIGVPSPSFAFVSGRPESGTCAELSAALIGQLPSPLCRTGRSPYGDGGFGFACSGGARPVLEAIGELAKSVTTL